MQELWRINLFVCVNDGGMVEINPGPPTYGAPYIPRSAGSGRLRIFCVTVLVSAHLDSAVLVQKTAFLDRGPRRRERELF